ncbi:hypothetical protein [Streptomyces sp. HUAS TT20]|uniref:hypothetical protein n=1 Tax=Streptomyces sp. HUAS TT20 TaxID=3447509 RepID=UPI0021D820A0|nr:hypothetical protein [Streptomyces sp. HUAS 15-9]UXY28777.1 hypothetical protein N8I87_20945 [Streptomyces sp. HUAS 15-9]
MSTCGRRGRELTVVLTSALPDPATHSLTSRSAPAVREFAGPEPRNVPLGVLGVLYVLVVAALPVRGAGERATVSWLVGIPCVLAPGVAAVVAGLRMLRDTVVLRARGIAVEGRLESSHDVGTGEDAVTHCVYSYADVSMTLLGFSLVGTAVAALFG